MYFEVIAWSQSINRGCNSYRQRLEFRPTGKWQDHNGDSSPGKVLPIAKILVSGNQHIKLTLRCGQQLAVGKLSPAHLERSGNQMVRQVPPQRNGRALIEKASHPGHVPRSRNHQATLGKDQDGPRLFS